MIQIYIDGLHSTLTMPVCPVPKTEHCFIIFVLWKNSLLMETESFRSLQSDIFVHNNLWLSVIVFFFFQNYVLIGIQIYLLFQRFHLSKTSFLLILKHIWLLPSFEIVTFLCQNAYQSHRRLPPGWPQAPQSSNKWVDGFDNLNSLGRSTMNFDINKIGCSWTSAIVKHYLRTGFFLFYFTMVLELLS